MKTDIPKPSKAQVAFFLDRWDELENYVSQEKSLKKLFTMTYPKNNEMDDVLIKVCSLNDFYSTNIFSPFAISRHIVRLDIDNRLKSNDESLVNEIAKLKIKDKSFNFYSFASKYCSHHKPEFFPIYDYYVEKMLIHLKKQDSFSSFKKKDLKEYSKYIEILKKFISFYELECSLKELDKYLWQAGKIYFPKRY
jgi:hypothetical protein